jgi:NAD(P)-dependent dehydrogenase (short-subunit alcohol dehydrogenase family)
MTYQNKVAFDMGTLRSMGVAIAERLVERKHKVSTNHAGYAATGDASSQGTTAFGGRALVIQGDVSANNAPAVRRDRIAVVFGRVRILTGSVGADLPNKLVAEIYEVVVRIHRGATADSLIEAAASIFEMALTIERDIETVAYWYCSDPIAALGGRTALQLVEKGESLRVLEFLESVKDGEED